MEGVITNTVTSTNTLTSTITTSLSTTVFDIPAVDTPTTSTFVTSTSSTSTSSTSTSSPNLVSSTHNTRTTSFPGSTSVTASATSSNFSKLTSNTLSTAVIGGTIAGSLTFLLAIGAFIFFLLRRRHIRHLNAHITPLEKYDPSLDDLGGPEHVEPGDKVLTNPQPVLLHRVPSTAPSQEPSSRSERHIMLEPEPEDDVRSQMVSMRATIARMVEHVRRIEAHIEEADLPPPTYISS